MSDLHDRHVRTTIPATWSKRLAHLATDLGIHRNELLREGLLLLLRYHGAAEGLPEPTPPASGLNAAGASRG